MKKNKVFFIILISIIVVGLFISLNSVELGKKHANSYVKDYGPDINNDRFLSLLELNTQKYLTLGNVLVFLGGIGIVGLVLKDS